MSNRVALSVLTTAAVLGLLGCGGSRGTSPSGGHTIVVVPPGQKGVYFTIVSPVAIPANKLRNKGDKVVAQAKGPQACSITKPIRGGHGNHAYLNGQAVTVKVNGSNPVTHSLCQAFRTERFIPQLIGK